MDSQNLQTFQLNIKKDLTIFELDIQGSLPAHQMVAILGASGSGKTSLLHCMAGISSFQGTWGKVNVTQKPTVGIVFQNYELFPHLSVYENIRYGLRWQKMAETERAKKIEFWAKELKLQQLLSRMPLHLSGGEKQRVALAQALVLSPDVLLLDEPTSSLDTNLKSKFLESLKALQTKWNLCVFWVTHDFREVLNFADHALLLDQGKMTQSGSPIELYEKPKNLWAGEFTGELNSLGSRQYLRPHHLQVSREAGKNPAKLLSLQNKGMYFMGLFETQKGRKLWGFLSRALELNQTYYLSWREEDVLTFSE